MNATGSLPHGDLLEHVGLKLDAISTGTDQLLLMRWRVLGLCQFLVGIGGGQGEAVDLTLRALDAFVREGATLGTDAAVRSAGAAIARAGTTFAGSVLPQISPEKQEAVRNRLGAYESLGAPAIERAMALLPALRDRLQRSPVGALMAGIRYRLELVAALVADTSRPGHERQRAAAAVLYLDELHDAIPDALAHVGLLDDDFALRLVLGEVNEYTEHEHLHWSERITALWDDLPFLQGVRLRHENGPVATTWLDRINSYVSYSHALDGAENPLVLVQPSVACSPLHSIVSLIGLLVLEGLTSSHDLLESLERGRVYEIDGQFHVRYDGLAGPPTPGWLRLVFRDGVVCRPPAIADRMVAVADRRLSSSKAFTAQRLLGDAEPIQKFFAWDEAIGAASLASRVLLVTSRQRATELLGGVRSNGVSLIDDGLVRFAGMSPSPDLVRAGLVLVIPTLAAARQLLDQGLAAHAIVVDGYERLHRGRHDLPFLLMRKPPPPVIAWSATGYYPHEPPNWLPHHRRLQVAADDLSCILELDGELGDDAAPSRASLWEAATAGGMQKVHVPWTTEERSVLASIDELVRLVRSCGELPDYWRYQLFSSATTIRTLVAATAACWRDIQELAQSWKGSFQQQWEGLRRHAAEQLAPLAQAVDAVVAEVARISAEENSKAAALLEFLGANGEEDWRVVCDRPEQVKATGRFLRRHGVKRGEPVLLRDLGVCKTCIVIGWRSVSFGRRLAAHTPRRLVALADETEGKRWDRLQAAPGSSGESLLEAVGHVRTDSGASPTRMPTAPTEPGDEELDWLEGDEAGSTGRLVPCIFLWLAGEREGKVLARDSRVIVEVGEHAREKPAHRLVPEDRVILAAGAGRWSPADEFTDAVVQAIEASHPDLVRNVREWRRALRQIQDARTWSTQELRDRLADVGVERELQTLDGWLRVEQAFPIGPQYLRRELEAMWPLLQAYSDRTVDEVVEACGRLRSLRSAAGRALLKLWKGRMVDLGIDNAWLVELVDRLRQEVQVHEVDAVTYGEVPDAMLGWWVGPEFAERYGARSPKVDVEPTHDEQGGNEDV